MKRYITYTAPACRCESCHRSDVPLFAYAFPGEGDAWLLCGPCQGVAEESKAEFLALAADLMGGAA